MSKDFTDDCKSAFLAEASEVNEELKEKVIKLECELATSNRLYELLKSVATQQSDIIKQLIDLIKDK